MASIFISYRRHDDSGNAGRLYDRLCNHFGDEQVFMDVDTIKPGDDFVQTINDEVGKCTVLLAVIGERWLTTTDETGRSRLKQATDFVRLELLAGIRNKKRVIPVLIGNARMPQPSELPKSLQELARRQAVNISNDRFRADVQQLIKSLETIVRPREAKPSSQPAFEPFRTYERHSARVTCVAFSADGRHVASGAAGRDASDFRCWRIGDGEDLRWVDYHSSEVHAIANSPDGKMAAIGSDVSAWARFDYSSSLAMGRLPDGEIRPVEMSAQDRRAVVSVDFSGDGRIVLAACGNFAIQWSVNDLRIAHRYGGSIAVRAVAFAKVGDLFASGSADHLVRIYHRDRVKSIHRMDGHTGTITSICFAPDASKLVSGSADQTIRVWRVQDGVPLRLLNCSSPVKTVAISPDGLALAAGLANGSIQLWHVADYRLGGMLEGHTLPVNQIAFSPDSKTLASASDDKTVKLWALR